MNDIISASKSIALNLIESEGRNPEYLSIVEMCGEWVEDNDASESDEERMVELVQGFIAGAVTTTILQDHAAETGDGK